MGLSDQVIQAISVVLHLLSIVAMWALMSTLAIATHEGGHALVARCFGSKVTIRVAPWGGYCRFPSTLATRQLYARAWFRMLLAIAGSVANVAAAILGILAWAAFGWSWTHPVVAYVILSLFYGTQFFWVHEPDSDAHLFAEAWAEFCASCGVAQAPGDTVLPS